MYGRTLAIEDIIINDHSSPTAPVFPEVLLYTKQWIYRYRCEKKKPTCKKWLEDVQYYQDLCMFNSNYSGKICTNT